MNNTREANIQTRRSQSSLVWIPRLTELLPAALGIRNGDVKIIKNAGGVVSHAFGSVVRSVLVGIFELGIEEVMVIGHTDCGVQHINSDMMIKHMMDRGVDEEKIE